MCMYTAISIKVFPAQSPSVVLPEQCPIRARKASWESLKNSGAIRDRIAFFYFARESSGITLIEIVVYCMCSNVRI